MDTDPHGRNLAVHDQITYNEVMRKYKTQNKVDAKFTSNKHFQHTADTKKDYSLHRGCYNTESHRHMTVGKLRLESGTHFTDKPLGN
eukprot:8241121-Heterocapsa_arctica.AAC.1